MKRFLVVLLALIISINLNAAVLTVTNNLDGATTFGDGRPGSD